MKNMSPGVQYVKMFADDLLFNYVTVNTACTERSVERESLDIFLLGFLVNCSVVKPSLMYLGTTWRPIKDPWRSKVLDMQTFLRGRASLEADRVGWCKPLSETSMKAYVLNIKHSSPVDLTGGSEKFIFYFLTEDCSNEFSHSTNRVWFKTCGQHG